MTNLYALTTELLTMMDADEVTDDQLQAAFGNVAEKAENVCKYLSVLSSQVDVFKTEEKRLSERRKAMENHHTRVKEFIRENMQRLGIDRLEAGTFTIALQKSPPSAEATDESATPARYITTVTSQTIDKKAIIADLKAGKEVAGWNLRVGEHIRIR